MKDTELILKSLNNSLFFSQFSLDERFQLSKLGEMYRYKAGDVIFTIEHNGNHFFLVHSGRLMLRLRTRQTKEYGRGEIFGEIAIFTDNHRTGTIKALDDVELIAFDKETIFNPNCLQESTILKLVTGLTKIIIGYFYADQSLSSVEMVKRGESHCVEFKESMNLDIKIFNCKIVQTLCAFMNLSGGTILIGVKDNGEIIGIKNSIQKVDEFIRIIVLLINERLGDYFSSLVNFGIEEVSNRIIVRIECERSPSPVFYRDKNKFGEEQEMFIIRTGTLNNTLEKTSDVIKYVQGNFKS